MRPSSSCDPAATLASGSARTPGRAGWRRSPRRPTVSRGRLAFWWEQEGEPASRVALELTHTDEGTRLRVVESRPLDVLDLVGIPLGGTGGFGAPDGSRYGPALVAG